ncbi:hypothetical protein [Amycolatopsis sp. H20-H5]|uniref:hypothetical protein n=1 Tax=Amycolatopsis sp. H20-H5 TaxID=3046309 RepID=UPI002DBC76AE|nr:hypothetical protein [Amycolatopsis sp. H20-H5]MEC3980602.1 hypothetical protein [Amycolatopsis sp. H20-H5]
MPQDSSSPQNSPPAGDQTPQSAGDHSSPDPAPFTQGTNLDPKQTILDDPKWRRSTDQTADWMRPDQPVHVSQWDHARPQAHSTISSQIIGIANSSSIEFVPGKAQPKITLAGEDGPLGYDLRRLEVLPGKWVKEFTVKVHLNTPAGATPQNIAAIHTGMERGINRFYNQGYRLPSGDQLHVRVEFVPATGDPHVTVDIHPDGERSFQRKWGFDDNDHTLAHEVGHTLGFLDHYVNNGVIFQDTRPGAQHHGKNGPVGDVRNRVMVDNGLMTDGMYGPDAALMPRELWMLEKNSTSLSTVYDVPYAALHGGNPPTTVTSSPYDQAANGDLPALTTLAGQGHRDSLKTLTDRGRNGDTAAHQSLVQIAGQGDLHAVSSLAQLGDQTVRPELDGKNPLTALTDLAYRPNKNEVAAAILSNLAASHHHADAFATLVSHGDSHGLAHVAARGGQLGYDAVKNLAANGDLNALTALGHNGDVAGLMDLNSKGSQPAYTVVKYIAGKGDPGALKTLSDLNDVPSLADLASQDSKPAYKALTTLAGNGNIDALNAMGTKGDVPGLTKLAKSGNPSAHNAVGALVTLAQNKNAPAHDALKTLTAGGNPDALKALTDNGDVPGLTELAKGGFKPAHGAITSLAGQGNADAAKSLADLGDVDALVDLTKKQIGPAYQNLKTLAENGNAEAFKALTDNSDVSGLTELAKGGHQPSHDAVKDFAGKGNADAARSLADLGDVDTLIDLTKKQVAPAYENLKTLAGTGNTDALKALSDSGDVPALTSLTQNGSSPAYESLKTLASGGNADALKSLTDNSDVSGLTSLALKGNQPAYEAVKNLAGNGNTDALKVLSDNNDVDGLTSLAKNGNQSAHEAVKTLAGNGNNAAITALSGLGDVNTLVTFAEQNNQNAYNSVKTLASQGNQDALQALATRNDVGALVDLAGQGSQSALQALQNLAGNGHVGALQAFADRGDTAAQAALAQRQAQNPAPGHGQFGQPSGPQSSIFGQSTTDDDIPLADLTPPPNGESSTNSAPDNNPDPAAPATATTVRNDLPPYLADSSRLGLASQLRRTQGADVGTQIDQLITGNFAHGVKVKGIDPVQSLTESDLGSFLGRGRKFAVMIGGRPHELTVKATFDWNNLDVGAEAKDAMSAESKHANEVKKSTSESRETNLPLNAFVSALPPLVVGASADIPVAPNTAGSRDTTERFRGQHAIEVKGAREVTVGVGFEISLADGDGHNVGGHGHTATGSVDLSVPIGLKQPVGDLTQNLTTPPPKEFAAEEVVVNGHDLVGWVGRELPAKFTRIGSPGRSVLQKFLGESNIKAQLPKMVVTDPAANPEQGWVRSDPLFKGAKGNALDFSTKGSAIEMRVVPRRVQVIDSIDDVESTRKAAAKFDTTTKLETKRQGGGSLVVGIGGDAGAIAFAVGPTGALSSVKDHTQEHSATTVAKSSVKATGTAVRYRTEYDLQVRVAGQQPRTLFGALTGFQWSTAQDAGRGGLTPTVAPNPNAARPRQHFAPAHIESGKSLGGSMVDDFDGGGKLYQAVADALRRVPGRKDYHLSSDKFIRQFGDGDFAKGISAGVTAVLQRDADIRSVLSDQQLSQLVDRMLGPGLQLPMVKKSMFHDYHVNLGLKATLDIGRDGDLLTADKISAEGKLKDKSGSSLSAGRSTTASFGVQARVLGQAAPTMSGQVVGGVRGAWTWTNSAKTATDGESSVTRSHGDSLAEDGDLGSRDLREFHGSLTIAPEITSYVRHNTDVRRISFGKPGRQTPPTQHQFLGFTTVPLRLLVPEHHVTTTPPPRLTVQPGPSTQVASPSIAGLSTGGSRVLDNAEIVTFVGAEHLQSSAKQSLVGASGDTVFGFSGGSNSGRISDKLSPEALRNDPRLFSRPVVVDGLHYGRRRADEHGTVGVSFSPTAVEVLPAKEYQKITNAFGANSKVSNSKGFADSITQNLGAWGSPNAPVTSTQDQTDSRAGGTVGAQLTPWAAGRGDTTKNEVKSGEKVTFSGGPEKRHLVKVDVRATVVAETRHRGNLDRFELKKGQPVESRGEQFDLPGAVVMWVNDAQLRELQNQAAAAQQPAPQRTVAPSSSMGPGQVSSIGIGGITAPVDLTDQIPALHHQLVQRLGQDAADRLLPKSTLDTSHDNRRAVVEFLSDVNRSMTSTLNGGQTKPLRLEDRFSGHTYYVSVGAEFTAPPVFSGIDHSAKLAVDDKASVVKTKEKTANRTIASLLASARLAGRMTHQSSTPDGQAQPTTGHGPASGFVALGQTAEASFGSRTRTRTDKTETEYKQSASVTGPKAEYHAELLFDLRIERGGERFAAAPVSREVTIRKMVGDSLPTPPNGAKFGQTGLAVAVDATQGTPDALRNWHAAPGHSALPATGTFKTDHFFGDVTALVDAARDALERSGVEVDSKTELALTASLNAAMFKGGLPALADGGFALPLPSSLGRDLEVHVRLGGNPALASASASVEVSGSRKQTGEQKESVVTGNGFSTTAVGPQGGGGVNHPTGADSAAEGKHNFGSVRGSSTPETKLGDSGPGRKLTQEGTLAAHSVTTPQSTQDNVTEDKRTRALVFDAEFRFVARPSGHSWNPLGDRHDVVTEVGVRDGYVIRMRDAAAQGLAGDLPDGLKTAVDDLAAKGDAWSKAVAKVEPRQLTVDGTRQANDLSSQARADAERRQDGLRDQLDDLGNRRDTLRSELAASERRRNALFRGDGEVDETAVAHWQGEIVALQGQLDGIDAERAALEADFQPETATNPAGVDRAAELAHRDARQAAHDAQQAADQSEAAWWQAVQEYDQQLADARNPAAARAPSPEPDAFLPDPGDLDDVESLPDPDPAERQGSLETRSFGFTPDSAELSAQDRARLDALARHLLMRGMLNDLRDQPMPRVEIVVHGFADTDLDRARAAAVNHALVAGMGEALRDFGREHRRDQIQDYADGHTVDALGITDDGHDQVELVIDWSPEPVTDSSDDESSSDTPPGPRFDATPPVPPLPLPDVPRVADTFADEVFDALNELS